MVQVRRLLQALVMVLGLAAAAFFSYALGSSSYLGLAPFRLPPGLLGAFFLRHHSAMPIVSLRSSPVLVVIVRPFSPPVPMDSPAAPKPVGEFYF